MKKQSLSLLEYATPEVELFPVESQEVICASADSESFVEDPEFAW